MFTNVHTDEGAGTAGVGGEIDFRERCKPHPGSQANAILHCQARISALGGKRTLDDRGFSRIAAAASVAAEHCSKLPA
jgi:hypothetical protein